MRGKTAKMVGQLFVGTKTAAGYLHTGSHQVVLTQPQSQILRIRRLDHCEEAVSKGNTGQRSGQAEVTNKG